MGFIKFLIALVFGLAALAFYGYNAASLGYFYLDIPQLNELLAPYIMTTPEQLAYAEQAPQWYVLMTAGATLSGLLGGLLLIFRAGFSKFLLMLAFVLTLAAMGVGLFVFNEAEIFGESLYTMYGIVAAVALVLWLVSLFAASRD